MTSKTFSEILKFNPYHDKLGRFTNSGAATSFTIQTRSKLSQGAAERAKEREKERISSIMPTEAQEKALNGIERRTRNLKKEQFRVVNRNGDVVMQKQGDAHSVGYKVGEAREHFPGNVTIHNHPSGGTFSTADLSDIGYGAKEIRAAAPEGTYILRNVNPHSKKNWYEMREDLTAASETFKNDRQIKKDLREKHKPEFQEKVQPIIDKWQRMKDNGASWDELNKVSEEYKKRDSELRNKIEEEARDAYVNQYHSWYRSNAGSYGLEYAFVPFKGRTQKGYYMAYNGQSIEKSSDTVILDAQMNGGAYEMADDVMRSFLSGNEIPFSRTQENGLAKSFSELMKFNPYHDKFGRFSNAGGAASFTYSPGKSRAHDLAIEREKKRMAGGGSSSKKGDGKFHPETLESETVTVNGKNYTVKDGVIVSGKKRIEVDKVIPVSANKRYADEVRRANANPDDYMIAFGTKHERVFIPNAVAEKVIEQKATISSNIDANMKRNVSGYDELKSAMEHNLKVRSKAYESEGHFTFDEFMRNPKVDESPNPKPNEDYKKDLIDIDALKNKYPRAVAYLRAESESKSSRAGNISAGKKAMERIRHGEDIDKVISDMETSINSINYGGYTRTHKSASKKMLEVTKSEDSGRYTLYIGLNVTGADELAIDGGEDTDDFHVTLLYGHFTPRSDEEDATSRIQSAIEEIKADIPSELTFDSIGRFEATPNSDGKDVIYAEVERGQLEVIHEKLLKVLKTKGIEVETTFPNYKPHMTLAYIDKNEDFPLEEIDVTAKITDISIGIGQDHEECEDNTFHITKKDTDKRLVFGWANIAIRANGEQIKDHQNDIVDPEDLETAAYEYVLNFRDGGEEHISSLRKKARMVESVVFTKEKLEAMGIPEGVVPLGWWIGFYVDDDEAWEKIKNGTYQMFSVEGKGIRQKVDDSTVPNLAKSFNEILKFNPYHDKMGRFATGSGFMNSNYMGDPDRQARTFSANPNTSYGAKAIARESANAHESIGRAYGLGGSVGTSAKKPKTDRKKPTKKPETEQKENQKEEPKSNFVSAKNRKEAVAYAKNKLGFDTVSYGTKMDIGTINHINEQITNIYSKYPELKGTVQTLKTTTSRGVYAQIRPFRDGTMNIEFGTSMYGRGMDYVKKCYESDVSTGFHPKGTTAKDVIWHEYGHVYGKVKCKEELGVAANEKVPPSKNGFYALNARSGKFEKDVATKAAQSLGVHPRELASNISRYAGKNSKELFAEAFAEFNGSPSPSQECLALMKAAGILK